VIDELGIPDHEQRLEKGPEEAWRGVLLNEAKQKGMFRTVAADTATARSSDIPTPQNYTGEQTGARSARGVPGVSEHQ
jgi:hypothetical protein